MNILIFSWRGPKHPHEGGAEIVTHEHAKYWVKNGHQVTLFTSAFENSVSEEVIDGVKILRRGGQVFGVQLQAFFWYIFKRNQTYDLIIDHFHGIPFFTPLYVRTKKIAFIHEIAKNVWLHNPWKGPFHYLPSVLGKFGEPFVFQFFYRSIPFLTVSASTKKDLVSYGVKAEQITVIHNGVKTMNVKFPKNKHFTIIFLGALAKDKGIEDAIKCFQIVSHSIPDARFWIVGKGLPDYISELTTLAKKLKVLPQITFYGFVSEEKKFEFLKRADVLLNSSVHEGWGLVNIEANSQGTPVVGYAVSGMVDSVKNKETGLLVNQGDVQALSDAIVLLQSDKPLYLSLSHKAVEWSKRYTWEQSCKLGLRYIESQ